MTTGCMSSYKNFDSGDTTQTKQPMEDQGNPNNLHLTQEKPLLKVVVDRISSNTLSIRNTLIGVFTKFSLTTQLT